MSKLKVPPAEGKLAVLLVGMGAVSTTLIAGVEAIKKGWGKPIGSLSQMGKWPKSLDLAPIHEIVFGGWDIFPDNVFQEAKKSKVLEPSLLEKLEPVLSPIRPMKAVFDPAYLRSLHGINIKKEKGKWALAQLVRQDIQEFQEKNKCQRGVMIVCSSTEPAPLSETSITSVRSFERKLKINDPTISPSMIYVYAALKEGMPIANATPNYLGEVSFLEELTHATNVPYAGSDLKTGQTLIKSILAPGLKKRLLGVKGWFSTNILGNRDGLVLSDPDAFRAKEKSKKSVLSNLLPEKEHPELYKGLIHQVDINYYSPKGDNKEGWDSIDLFGWLGYPMELKINFLCRDSILAAPLVLDLVLFLDLAKRSGRKGMQDWLGFYFKSPFSRPGQRPEHDLSEQHRRLEEILKSFC